MKAIRQITAFTLVELLVTIAIIGILAALLLMVLSNGKLKAHRARCLSNVKQLSLGSFMFANENSRHAGIETSAFPGGNWMGTLNEFANARGILICPSATLRDPPPASGNRQGYADRAWVRWTSDNINLFIGSYGYNGWLYSDMKHPVPAKQPLIFSGESSIGRPAMTPVFFDLNWVDVWPEATDRPYTNLYTGQPFGISPNQMGRCTIARHWSRSAASAPQEINTADKLPGAINMGFADGHAGLVKLENLWTLNWHREWQPPATRPK